MASPWDHRLGAQRLCWLTDAPPVEAPRGYGIGPYPLTQTYLRALRHYAVHTVEPELLHTRQDVWRYLDDDGPVNNAPDPDPWWTLEPSEDLGEYRNLLENDLQCDRDSVIQWVQLVRLGPMGRMEGLRLLHHLLKDKSMSATIMNLT